MEPQYFQIDPASVFQATARSKRSGRKKLEKTESIYLAVARHIARAKGFHAGDVVTLGVIAITPKTTKKQRIIEHPRFNRLPSNMSSLLTRQQVERRKRNRAIVYQERRKVREAHARRENNPNST